LHCFEEVVIFSATKISTGSRRNYFAEHEGYVLEEKFDIVLQTLKMRNILSNAHITMTPSQIFLIPLLKR